MKLEVVLVRRRDVVSNALSYDMYLLTRGKGREGGREGREGERGRKRVERGGKEKGKSEGGG